MKIAERTVEINYPGSIPLMTFYYQPGTSLRVIFHHEPPDSVDTLGITNVPHLFLICQLVPLIYLLLNGHHGGSLGIPRAQCFSGRSPVKGSQSCRSHV